MVEASEVAEDEGLSSTAWIQAIASRSKKAFELDEDSRKI